MGKPKPKKETLALRALIEKLRAKRDGSMEKLAVDLGVSMGTLYRWWRGAHAPSRLAMQRLKEAK